MKTMNKLMRMIFMLCLLSIAIVAKADMSMSKVRESTRFLTDRMRYELNLSYNQYNDVFEVNFDYINNARRLMPYVVRGESWAIADYYRILDVRNDDLRWILSSSQYSRFLEMDYFFRPIYATNNVWNFRIYLRYNNPTFFYFGPPVNYHSYSGAHYRTYFNNISYYKTHFAKRYHHPIYDRYHSTRHEKVYGDNCRHDFGHAPKPRPNNNGKPNNQPSNRPDDKPRPNQERPSFHIGGNNGQSSSRPNSKPDKPGNTLRPSTSSPNGRPNRVVNNTSHRPSANTSRPERSAKNTSSSQRESATRTPSTRGYKEKTTSSSSSAGRSSSATKEREKVSKRSYYGNADVEKRSTDSSRK